jgi:hypothetical protein
MDYGKQSFVDPADRLRLHKLNPARGSLCWRWLPVSSSWCCACAVRDDSAIALQDPDFLAFVCSLLRTRRTGRRRAVTIRQMR